MVLQSRVSLAESFGEGYRLNGLRAVCSVGMERVADDDYFYAVLADEAGDGFQVSALAGAVQGEEWLRGQAQRVGDRETDSFVTDVERESARVGHES
jgi:hypothetical protein